MENKNYTATIEVSKPPQDVFGYITNDVAKWWGGRDLEGNSKKLNDEFVIHHPSAHYSKQKLVEVVPNKKVVWLVTESKLSWLQDMGEWTNTKMIFEITGKGDKTVLHFKHEGLSPEKECYEKCEQGWNMVIKDWLFNFITAGEIKIHEHHIKMKSFHRSIPVNISAREAINKISKVPEWWGVTCS
jgi:uncharacterized protein YndB with AHSA1/START domain